MNCKTHADHTHQHGPGCGHKAIKHEDHVDYLHDGHLHYTHDGHTDEHMLDGSQAGCTPDHKCSGHEEAHEHGPKCGHEAIPHAGHMDYVVGGHLHHPCSTHCDDHGAVELS